VRFAVTLLSLIKITVLVSLAALVASPGKAAADPTIITLSCDGTTTSLPAEKQDPVAKVGVVVNLAQRDISFAGYTIPITKMDTTTIGFEGDLKRMDFNLALNTSVAGHVDRVTGAFNATIFKGLTWTDWKLSCKPVAPLF
jgi:hypothetical protein